ncbi:amine oxidase, partial [Streptomyces albidoflavus]
MKDSVITCDCHGRPRVGGRALTRFLADGTQLDLGGRWIGSTQRPMA